MNRNNHAKLKGHKLTDNEFNQVKRKITGISSPYEAAKLLEGENGIGKIEIIPENSDLGKVVRLEIFWKADVAGGKSSYEVVQQVRRPDMNNGDPNRRFDVTLLINGLPLIQLELKRSEVELTQAFNQVMKYADEGKYKGIFSLLQMFVIMTPDSSAYFANAKPGKFNPSFLFHWRNKDKKRIENGKDFTDEVLSIPMAHKMISEYKVIDEERKQLILLRPYQIYAIQSVMERIHKHEDGFIWHTTGSGKTLTSYKTAKLAAQNPAVDRVLFVVDRKALDEQTNSNFQAYAANDDMEINEAQNTGDLIKKMKINDGRILVTSIQKLYRAVSKYLQYQKDGKNTQFSKLFDKRIVFFVDEAHRSQFGSMQKVVREAFPEGNWYGYTGTPIFKQNHKKIQGDMPVTTEELFGKQCEPNYTIRDALDDNSVLPFNVEHKQTISDDEVENRAFDVEKMTLEKHGASLIEADNKAKERLSKMSSIQKESYLSENNYMQGAYVNDSNEIEDNSHIAQVVQFILDYGPQKTSLGNGNYNAILTTSSIEMAKKYYKAFKHYKNTYRDNNYPNPKDVNWPRVAITFSLSENDDDSNENRKELKKILDDYNHQYDTNFTIETLDLYNQDVSKRAARREDNYAHLNKDEQINIVIVVKRLLTGFDAPKLNTLFVDRILQYQELIQAYSRTNRLQNRELKQEGQIVTFRKPYTMDDNEQEAYRLYGGEGSFGEIIKPKYEQARKQFKNTINNLRKIANTPDDVDQLEGNRAKVKFVRAFRLAMRQLNSLSMYTDFTWEDSQKQLGIQKNEFEHYAGKYNNIKTSVQNKPTGEQSEDDSLNNIDFSMSTQSTVLVDYDYITDLIQEYADQRSKYIERLYTQEHMSDYIQLEADIQNTINEYEDSGYRDQANRLREEVNDIKQYFDQYQKAQGKSAVEQDRVKRIDVREKIQKDNQKIIKGKINDFCNKWGLDDEALLRVANEHPQGTDIWTHEGALMDSANPDKSNLSPLMYKMQAQPAWRKLIEKDLSVYL